MSPNPLRYIPSVNELLESPPLKGLVEKISDSAAVAKVRTALEEMRDEVQAAAQQRKMPSLSGLAERISERIAGRDQPCLQPVINATGVLLGGSLGQAPLADEAVAAVNDTTAATRDYYRTEKTSTAEELLRQATGAEAALVVDSPAGAIVLATAAIASGGKVAISRGQLGEIEAGCRLPELIAAAGVQLLEVGTVNRTLLDDYSQAIGRQAATLMTVEPGSFAVTGWADSVPVEELAAVAHRHQLPLIHEIGIGGLLDLNEFDISAGLTAPQSIQAGSDVVLLRGDGLLGGPQCGIILGRRTLLQQMRSHSLAAALSVGQPTLAGLAATLRLYDDPQKARHAVPLLQLLTASAENLQNRAQRLAPQIAAAGLVEEAEPLAATSCWYGRPIAARQLPTWCIAVKPAEMGLEELADRLAARTPPIVARVDEDRLLLDLRSVFPRQDTQLVAAFQTLQADEDKES